MSLLGINCLTTGDTVIPELGAQPVAPTVRERTRQRKRAHFVFVSKSGAYRSSVWSGSLPGCSALPRLQLALRSRRSWRRTGWPPPETCRYFSCIGCACCRTSWIPVREESRRRRRSRGVRHQATTAASSSEQWDCFKMSCLGPSSTKFPAPAGMSAGYTT